MLEVSGGFILKCDRCGSEKEYGAEVLEPKGAVVLEEKPLGLFIRYGFEASLHCECGQSMRALFSGYEYPEGLHLKDESESRGCSILEPPDIDDETIF